LVIKSPEICSIKTKKLQSKSTVFTLVFYRGSLRTSFYFDTSYIVAQIRFRW